MQPHHHGAEESRRGALTDHDGQLRFLDFRNPRNQPALGYDSVPHLKRVQHGLVFLLPLGLRTKNQEIQNDENQEEGQEG